MVFGKHLYYVTFLIYIHLYCHNWLHVLFQSVLEHVTIVVQRLMLGKHVCSTVTCVVTSVCAFHQEHLVIRKNVHVITTGKIRKENLSALDLILNFFYQL